MVLITCYISFIYYSLQYSFMCVKLLLLTAYTEDIIHLYFSEAEVKSEELYISHIYPDRC